MAYYWSKEKLKQLKLYMQDGLKPNEIAKVMGVSYSSAYAQVQKINMIKPDNGNEDKNRHCLKCSKEFVSSGSGNRLCHGCKVNNGIYADVGCW